jgi:HK97 family phage major capsid protein
MVNVWWKWLQSASKPGGEFRSLTEREQKALSEGTDTAGGFLVPDDFAQEILARRNAESVVRRFARIMPTTRDVLQMPAAAPHGSAPSTYSSAFVGGMYSETSPSISYTTDPVFAQVTIPIRKQRAGVKVSWDLLADAPSLRAFLADDGGRNLALVETISLSTATAQAPTFRALERLQLPVFRA